jgi:hypothetical protein
LAKEDKAKIKMTVIHFETESDNATLQENIRAITQTLTRALASPQRVAYIPAQLPSANGVDTNPNIGVDDEPDVLDAEVMRQARPLRHLKRGAERAVAGRHNP